MPALDTPIPVMAPAIKHLGPKSSATSSVRTPQRTLILREPKWAASLFGNRAGRQPGNTRPEGRHRKLDGDKVIEFPKLPEMPVVTLKVLRREGRVKRPVIQAAGRQTRKPPWPTLTPRAKRYIYFM